MTYVEPGKTGWVVIHETRGLRYVVRCFAELVPALEFAQAYDG